MENEYRKLKDAKEWSPAKHAQDSKAPPSKFGGANVAQVLTDVQIMALMQSGFASGAKTGTCNHCKKPGHWKRECPQLQNQPARGNTRGSRTTGRAFSNAGVSEHKGWQKIPPAVGDEKLVKQVAGNPKPFRWCAKCKRWTTTHHTDTHTGGNAGRGAQANVFLVPDPSAWLAEFPSPQDRYLSFMMALPSLLIALSLGVLVTIICLLDASTIQSYVGSTSLSLFQVLSQVGLSIWANRVHYALFMWLLLFGAAVLWRPGVAAPDPRPRRLRRAEAQAYRRATKPRRQCIRVRKKPPTLEEQEVSHQVADFHALVLRLFNYVLTNGRSSMFPPEQEGEKKPQQRRGKRDKKPKHDSHGVGAHTHQGCQRRRRASNCRRAPYYRPVPSTSQGHGPCNLNWTRRQTEAAEALLALTFEVPTNPKLLNIALQSPFRTKPKETYTRVIWDSGASVSISPSKDDFVGEFFTTPTLVQLQGLAKGLKIRGQGHVMWAFRDTEEQLRMIKVPAYYVPSTNVRLLSTTNLLQT